MLGRYVTWVLLIWCMVCSAWARAPMVPEVLKPWQEWVLWGHEAESTCPHLVAEGQSCVWPGQLALTIQDQTATFTQKVQVYNDSWVVLPGDSTHWPNNVLVNQTRMPVVEWEGHPSLYLSAGQYEVTGSLSWESQPDYLTIPDEVGLFSLSLNGKTLKQPDRDKSGKVWLQRQTTKAVQAEDSLTLQVFRRLHDTLPFEDETLLRLRVAGQAREITLGPVLLADFQPTSLKSPLPARLDENGMLRIQVTAGIWNIIVKSNQLAPVKNLALNTNTTDWPNQEIWVFDPDPILHLTEVTGGQAIDPTQTELPKSWQAYQAFLVKPDTPLTFVEKRRGLSTQRTDDLSLHRSIWLDFDGRGMTFEDHFSGKIEKDWRLNIAPEFTLGRVNIEGADRLITKSSNGEAGVEIRHGNIDLTAWSELPKRSAILPAIGWNHDIEKLSAIVQLPPGWQLLAATGVDVVRSAWIDRWTLLDVFLVLVIAAVVARLFNKRWGLLALITLALIYHERGAPIYTWLNVLAVVALLRVLPAGTMQHICQWYYRASVVVLLFILLPFAVDQVRQGMYPQLTSPSRIYARSMVSTLEEAAAPKMLRQRMMNQVEGMRDEAWSSADTMSAKVAGVMMPAQPREFEDYDPEAKVQTGPGVPQWSWRQVQLNWHGPVIQSQSMHLWLIPPWLSQALNFIRVILSGLLAYIMLRIWRDTSLSVTTKHASTMALSVLCGIGLLSMIAGIPTAQAEIPDEAMLNELQKRLLAPADCAPNCAAISQMFVQIDENSLRVRMEANVLSPYAIPLPSAMGSWMPAAITVDGQAVEDLKISDHTLYLVLAEGVHQIEMVGPLADLTNFSLPIPLKPKQVTITEKEWKVTGLNKGQLIGDAIQFQRVTQSANMTQLKAGEFPPFVMVSRELMLGLTWKINTRVQRVSPAVGPIQVSMPLLPGEKILDKAVTVKEDKALIVLQAHQATLNFVSEIPMVDQLTITAPTGQPIAMHWDLEASAIWHVDFGGVPAMRELSPTNRWRPSWGLWPGEQVSLTISRPEAVAGKTLTIDDSQTSVSAGKRALNMALDLRLRASQGQTHAVTLPQGATLQDVQIDGLAQPINLQGDQLLLPIHPGEQSIHLKWQMPHSLTTFFQTPNVKLNTDSSNAYLNLQVGKDRWILGLGGPRMGPVVLFWGIAIVVVAVAFLLGRLKFVPLGFWQWALLGLGIAVAAPWAAVGVLVWFFAFAKRNTLNVNALPNWAFRCVQVGLAILTFIFIVSLIVSISKGLLGTPQMQLGAPHTNLVSNYYGSPTAYRFGWYQDKVSDALPQAWVFTLSIYWYRAIMLAWALWLAFSLIRWFKWGWESFSVNGLWSVPTKTQS